MMNRKELDQSLAQVVEAKFALDQLCHFVGDEGSGLVVQAVGDKVSQAITDYLYQVETYIKGIQANT